MKYPNLWTEKHGSSLYDSNGELTPIAKNWAGEIQRLTPEQVKIGIRDLSYRDNAQYPPTAIEFASHCRKVGLQECIDQIFDYLNQSSDSNWWWTSEVAFNVYKKLNYNTATNESSVAVAKRIESIYKTLDMFNLVPIPSRSIPLPIQEPTKVERSKQKFQAKMWGVIMRFRPDLLGEVDRTREVNGYPAVKQDFKTACLFKPERSKELMAKWYQQKQPDMLAFLRSEGIAV